jgi:hypothetical protein
MMYALLFVGGYYLFLLIVLISLAHVRLQHRIAVENISQPAIQMFREQLRFPVSLFYNGVIGHLIGLENPSSLLRRLTLQMTRRAEQGDNRLIAVFVLLLVILIGSPLSILLDGAVNSDSVSQQLIYVIGLFAPILTTAIIRPWRFGQKLRDIDAELAPIHPTNTSLIHFYASSYTLLQIFIHCGRILLNINTKQAI